MFYFLNIFMIIVCLVIFFLKCHIKHHIVPISAVQSGSVPISHTNQSIKSQMFRNM